MICPSCSLENPPKFRFCNQCGSSLRSEKSSGGQFLLSKSERKLATVIFCDLCGYTELTEAVDPEDVKAVMSQIFTTGAKIIQKYSGSVERFLGDEIMAVFGSPVAHEDDAIRAVRVAKEIHAAVSDLDERLRNRIRVPLIMRSGINTGIILTDEEAGDPLSFGITGDAVNLAKRLQTKAIPGEILVGQETYRQTSSYFSFESLEPMHIKGKNRLQIAYKVLSTKPVPDKIHRFFGRRADLIGRDQELKTLKRITNVLLSGEGGIVCISGDVGTGKSRLVVEYKKMLDSSIVGWCEGFAHEYTQNISYFPIIDLLRRQFKIAEDDVSAEIRTKIETGLSDCGADLRTCIHLINLFSLDASHETIEPENWKVQLHEAIKKFFSSLARRKPMVVCFEDLHWFDPSTLDLMRALLSELDYPVLFLIVYRTPFDVARTQLFHGCHLKPTHINIDDLMQTDTLKMVQSLLQTQKVPKDLMQFVSANAQGNPFFIEEIVNSLVDSRTLVPDKDEWKFLRPTGKHPIALTIQGVITGRIDRLSSKQKQILKEASVIGNSFAFDILHRLSKLRYCLEQSLIEMEDLDLLCTKYRLPNLQYSFKHVLTREVVYGGLLTEERQHIHNRIAEVIERHNQERLPEHYETLAFHFKMGNSIHKAVDYLMRSGRKSLKRYAVEESHRFFREAYELLAILDKRSTFEDRMIVEILNSWCPVYYYRGHFDKIEHRMQTHLQTAEGVGDEELRGMYYIGLGMCLWAKEDFRHAYRILHQALEIGKKNANKKVLGYASGWLPWVACEIGLFDEALKHAEQARKMSNHIDSDHFPYYQSWPADAFVNLAMGNCGRIFELGELLLSQGQKHLSRRGITWGHIVKGWAHLSSGDFVGAMDCYKEALKVSADPFYAIFPKLFLGMSCVGANRFQEAKVLLEDVALHGRQHGPQMVGEAAEMYLSVVYISEGKLQKGFQNIRNLCRHYEGNGALWRQANAELLMGEIYLKIACRGTPIKLMTAIKNLSFLLKTIPFVRKKTENHFRKTDEIAKQIGAIGLHGRALLGLGHLYANAGRITLANEYINEAIAAFKQGQATVFLEQAMHLKMTLNKHKD